MVYVFLYWLCQTIDRKIDQLSPETNYDYNTAERASKEEEKNIVLYSRLVENKEL